LCDFEAALNAQTKVFAPLDKSQEAAKSFRDFSSPVKPSRPIGDPQTGCFLSPETKGKKAGKIGQPSTRGQETSSLLLLGLLGAIGCATTLALARVFAFATVVTRLAAAFAFAGILAFASVLFLDLLVALLVLALVLALLLGAEGSLQRRKQSRGLDSRASASEQSRERRAREHSLCGFRHFSNSPVNLE
jgi:uncharacterized membrane protein